MGVNKIIYVTPARWQHNDLSPEAKSQLNKIGRKLLAGETVEKPIVFRSIRFYHPSRDGLSYLAKRCSEAIKDNFNLNFISDPNDVNDIINSAQQGKTVVVGVTQEELKDVLETLRDEGYNVVAKHKIKEPSTMYTVSIDLNDKDNSGFFEAIYE